MIGGRKGSSNENKAELFGNCKGHERGVRKQRLGAPVDRTLVCVSPSMNTKSRRRPLCRCCESAPGILGDSSSRPSLFRLLCRAHGNSPHARRNRCARWDRSWFERGQSLISQPAHSMLRGRSDTRHFTRSRAQTPAYYRLSTVRAILHRRSLWGCPTTIGPVLRPSQSFHAIH